MKECKRCNKFKDKKYFYKDYMRKDKLNPWCKDCIREHNKMRSEKISKYQKEYYKANRERLLMYQKKYKIIK